MPPDSAPKPRSLHDVAPWLPPPRCPKCWYRLKNAARLVLSLFVLVYILLLSLTLGILELPKLIVRFFLRVGTTRFGMIVEHCYALSVCKLHVNIGKMVQNRYHSRRYHSRYADIRTELILRKGKGSCFVHAIPVMTDNYSYIIVDASAAAGGARGGLPCCAVDPADASAVAAALQHLAESFYSAEGGLRLEAVLCTHKHWDHAGGNVELIRLAAALAAEEEDLARAGAGDDMDRGDRLLQLAHPLRVYAGEEEDAPGCTHPVRHGDKISVGNLSFEAVGAPGHTLGSLMFRLATLVLHGDDRVGPAKRQASVEEPEASQEAGPQGQERLQAQAGEDGRSGLPMDVLFTGDAVFSGGCGAQFEGCDRDTEHCFATVLAQCSLPDALLFPGHEYTVHLLDGRVKDAAEMWGPVEPPGQFLAHCAAYYVAAHRRALRDKVPTVPCMLGSERLLNPHFDRTLRRYADILFALVASQDGDTQRASAEPTSSSAQTGATTTRSSSTDAEQERTGDSGRSESALPLLQAEHAHASPSSAGPSRAQQDLSRGQEGPQHPPQPGGTGDAPQTGSSPEDRPRGSGERRAGAPRGDKPFLTGTAAPAFQFAFLYRSELEQLRLDLMEGSCTGPEAAARLMDCERRVFTEPVLTGPPDRFTDEGLTPHEEWTLFHGEVKERDAAGGGGAEGSAEKGEAQDTAENDEESSEEEDEEEESEPTGDGRPDWAKGRPFPSRQDTVTALKVLGVLADVPIGPKAPCADEDLPVCLGRLEVVLRQLGVLEPNLQALIAMLHKDGLFGSSFASSGGSCCDTPARPGDQADVCVESRIASGSQGPRDVCVTHPPQSQPAVVPLRQVLQALWPMPLQQSAACCSSLTRCFRRLRRCARRCCRRRPRRRPPAVVEEEEPPEREGESFEEPPSPLQEQLRRRRATERIFSAHKLDGCPLCSGYFRACPSGCSSDCAL